MAAWHSVRETEAGSLLCAAVGFSIFFTFGHYIIEVEAAPPNKSSTIKVFDDLSLHSMRHSIYFETSVQREIAQIIIDIWKEAQTEQAMKYHGPKSKPHIIKRGTARKKLRQQSH